ncbi:MAG: uroporphyrinogen-III synthase [Magnetospirillum sp.]|nr:uroporphyrinogen-III synthase [Magnetospirillum sp.]
MAPDRKPLALVTRPREDSEAVAKALAERGLDIMVEPLLDILPLDGVAIDTCGVQGILGTSANGIRALARVLPDRAIPVFAVGDASARVARELGYTAVESAGGDVDTLAELVAARTQPSAGALLHAAGTAVAGDLAGRLGGKGFEVRRVVLYEARTATRLSPVLSAALAAGAIDLALFFSPRTAATFATLVRDAGAAGELTRIAAYGLSANVARELASLPWRVLRTAAQPTQAALLAALDDDLGTDLRA